MLVITRKEGQSLMIGNDIEINISKITDGSVKIAIDAPKKKRILRTELISEVKAENVTASKADLDILKSFKL